MMTREDIRELASFQAQPEACAITLYFQPRTPQNRAHKEDAIVAKDLVKRALQEAAKQGKNGCARTDLDRILELAGSLRGNQAKAKAVFASSANKIWREFDLPANLPETQLFVNRRFHLKPLAGLLGAHPSLAVALIDRQRGRFFDLRLDELTERDGLFRKLPANAAMAMPDMTAVTPSATSERSQATFQSRGRAPQRRSGTWHSSKNGDRLPRHELVGVRIALAPVREATRARTFSV